MAESQGAKRKERRFTVQRYKITFLAAVHIGTMLCGFISMLILYVFNSPLKRVSTMLCVCARVCDCETAGWKIKQHGARGNEALPVNWTEHVSLSERRCGTSELAESHLTAWKQENVRGAGKQKRSLELRKLAETLQIIRRTTIDTM